MNQRRSTLLNIVKKMREQGELLNGEKINGAFPIITGAIANPYMGPLDLSIIRLGQKVEAGADFIQTHAVFDVDAFQQWLGAAKQADIAGKTAILAGVPVTITFLVDLYQERSLWFDRKAAGVVIKQAVQYNSVKKTFYVWLLDRQEPEGFQDFEGAKRAMTELNGVVVAPVRQLQKNRPTYIMIKAKLDKVRLPLGMEYVFFFVSLWDFETDWYKQRFMF